jgi:hypothetical protein
MEFVKLREKPSDLNNWACETKRRDTESEIGSKSRSARTRKVGRECCEGARCTLATEMSCDSLSRRFYDLRMKGFHMNIEEANLADALVSASSLVGHVHFADSNRLAPGWGHVDFSKILAALSKIGYDGPFGVEILPKPDDLAAAGQAINHLRELP